MAEKNGFSRRNFLKVIGAGAGAATVGCKPDVPEKLVPYLIQPNEVIPGVATWYSGTCDQCAAGCGWIVRTREGRALKVEGNPEHPINKGGLCALAQSSLQELYDPDRLREPLSRKPNSGPFKSVKWSAAIDSTAGIFKSAKAEGKEVVLLTAPLDGSIKELVGEFVSNNSYVRHVEWDPAGQDLLDVAAEQTYGPGARLAFDFSKAEFILNFGTDFLETWKSPVEYSRQWAENRRPENRSLGGGKISEVIHLEPRLSLTAANADRWLKIQPGSESAILLTLLEIIVGRKSKLADKGGVSPKDWSLAESLLKSTDYSARFKSSGISRKQLEKIAGKLIDSSSLVLAYGYSARGAHALANATIANILNQLLGNAGRSVKLSKSGTQKVEPSDSAMQDLIADMAAKDTKIAALMVVGVNPVYQLPASSKCKEAISKISNVISVTTKLDETAQLANIILPKSTGFEAWGDSQPRAGIYNLSQPAMQPLYSTQSFADTLLAIEGKLGFSRTGVGNFQEYLKVKWAAKGLGGSWEDAVQSGGVFKAVEGSSLKSLSFSADGILKSAKEVSVVESKGPELTLLTFPTVRSRVGESANRPWIQELPDPLTSVVWGSWVEIHPGTAKHYGLKHGQIASIRTDYGYVEVPVYVTENISEKAVAIPMGAGHVNYGRYAEGVGANAVDLLPYDSKQVFGVKTVGLTGMRAAVATEAMVTTQQFHEQFDRGIVRNVSIHNLGDEMSSAHHNQEHSEGRGHGDTHAEHEDPLTLGPREVPKQMYEQMEHPLYRWGMSIDVAACTGCSACVVACYAENNVPVVGKDLCQEGREMSWIRIEHYNTHQKERPYSGFQPMLCQHCNNAPCEPVCPVYATYHNEEGLNTMVYNRCVGTRYCGNNCSYKVRRFNWFKYDWPEPLTWQLNPDVTVREAGIMEKCSFCVQRIKEGENRAKNEGRPVRDGEVKTACESSCPTQAIKFGNLKDESSRVSKDAESKRGYKVLDSAINTQPAITYLARVTHDNEVS